MAIFNPNSFNMRHCAMLLFILSIVSFSSCRKDFEFEPSTGDLEFSRDTVYLDTVFTNIGSSTYTLKVYNRSGNDILIPSIKLGKADSKYRMTVDGMTGIDEDGSGVGDGRFFPNVELLARDSMYIFIETTASIADANPTDFLYTDQIEFGAGSDLQTVELVTLIQDAIFLYPQRDDAGVYETIPVGVDENGEEIREKGFFLEDSELTWTSEKPYVIYGYAGVPANATLTIDAGAHVHFHDDSALIAYNGSNVNVNGTVEEPVIFEGDRLEPLYADVPGQWLTIYMTQGSRGNFNNMRILNSTVGILVAGNDGTDDTLQLNNVQIYGASNFGILAYTGHIVGQNVAMGSSGVASFAGTFGGKYNFVHSTFNNNWPSSGQFAVWLNDWNDDGNPATPLQFQPLEEASFHNCIIYGSNQVELFLDKKNDSGTFNYYFNHSLIRLNSQALELALYDVNNPAIFNSCYVSNGFSTFIPEFWNANGDNLRITEESDAIGLGDPAFLIPTDVIGNPRDTSPPDLGAFQHQPIPEDEG